MQIFDILKIARRVALISKLIGRKDKAKSDLPAPPQGRITDLWPRHI
jgi:hypothetical protein